MADAASETTTRTIFEQAIGIEKTAAKMYAGFSKLFSHFEDIASFWDELTEEEVEHAKTLREVRDTLTDKQLDAPCDRAIWDSIQQTLQMIRSFDSQTIKNLDDAYEQAHELEYSEVNAVFKLLTTRYIRSKDRRQFIVSEISKHQQKLINFKKHFGGRSWRKEIGIHNI